MGALKLATASFLVLAHSWCYSPYHSVVVSASTVCMMFKLTVAFSQSDASPNPSLLSTHPIQM